LERAHPKQNTPHAPPQRDWWGLACALLLAGWIDIISLGAHWIAWFAEQSLIIANIELPAWVWPAVGLGTGLSIAVPTWALALLWKRPRYRAAFQTWAVASTSILLLLPLRLVPPGMERLAALLQTAGCVAYAAIVIALVLIRKYRGGSGPVLPSAPYLPALALTPLLTLGWILWGALGSVLDVVLGLVSALTLGLAVGLTVGHWFLGPLRRTSPGVRSDLGLGGLVVGTTLLLMCAAFGYNGQQLILTIALPAAGRLLVGVALHGRDDPRRGWLSLGLLYGLIAAGPVLGLDPDELVLLLNFGSRDVLQWSLIAAAASMALSWLAGALLWLLKWPSPGQRVRQKPWAAFAALTWVGGLVLYLVVGQPGLHGDRLFVILRNQADVSFATEIADYGARRQAVYDTLIERASADQSDIRAVLDWLGVAYTPYYLVNAIEVDAGPLLRLWLQARPEVDRVLDNPALRPLPALPPTTRGTAPPPSGVGWNLEMIGADRVWRELRVTGEGIVVGQSDSGAEWEHPELRAAYRGRDGDHDYDWLDPWYHTRAPVDIGGHGTHTLGTIVGPQVGVAPGATWYACVNLARNLGNPARYLDCMQFMLAPYPQDGDPFTDGAPELGAHVINNSWGCPPLEGCDPTSLVAAVRALRAAGVFVVASAGNEGDACASISSPIALYDESFSVGAADADGRLAFFSSRGPVSADGSNRVKPDIVAPGVRVYSAYPDGTYEYADGTSMAGPHVVGVVALMWSANPALIGDIERTEQILADTARPYDYARHGTPRCANGTARPNNAVGYGTVDAFAAVRAATDLADRQ